MGECFALLDFFGMTDQFHASWNGLGIVEEREIDIWVNGEDILEMFRRADLRKATKAGGKIITVQLPDCIRDVCTLSPNLSLCKSRQTFCVYLRPFQFSPTTYEYALMMKLKGIMPRLMTTSITNHEDRILYPKDQWNPVRTVSFSLLS